MAQVFGKKDGLSKGKDSYLHSGDPSLGIFGSTSMLGTNLPVACGIALAFYGEGDHVAKDEPLVEVSTDKVDVEVPSPRSTIT